MARAGPVSSMPSHAVESGTEVINIHALITQPSIKKFNLINNYIYMCLSLVTQPI